MRDMWEKLPILPMFDEALGTVIGDEGMVNDPERLWVALEMGL